MEKCLHLCPVKKSSHHFKVLRLTYKRSEWKSRSRGEVGALWEEVKGWLSTHWKKQKTNPPGEIPQIFVGIFESCNYDWGGPRNLTLTLTLTEQHENSCSQRSSCSRILLAKAFPSFVKYKLSQPCCYAAAEKLNISRRDGNWKEWFQDAPWPFWGKNVLG